MISGLAVCSITQEWGKRRSGHSLGARRVRHKPFGKGAVIDIKDSFIIVNFEKVGREQLNYHLCKDKGLIEFL